MFNIRSGDVFVTQTQHYPEGPQPVYSVHVGAETVIVLDAGAGFVLVQSVTEPAAWHVVEHGRCSCPGYLYRATCRHLAVAMQAASLATLTARRS